MEAAQGGESRTVEILAALGNRDAGLFGKVDTRRDFGCRHLFSALFVPVGHDGLKLVTQTLETNEYMLVSIAACKGKKMLTVEARG